MKEVMEQGIDAYIADTQFFEPAEGALFKKLTFSTDSLGQL